MTYRSGNESGSGGKIVNSSAMAAGSSVNSSVMVSKVR